MDGGLRCFLCKQTASVAVVGCAGPSSQARRSGSSAEAEFLTAVLSAMNARLESLERILSDIPHIIAKIAGLDDLCENVNKCIGELSRLSDRFLTVEASVGNLRATCDSLASHRWLLKVGRVVVQALVLTMLSRHLSRRA